MKKILIISDNIPTQINGVVTTFNNIEKCALNDGFVIEKITPLNFYYFSAPGYSEVKLSIPFKIGNLIEKSNADYIHIATEGPVGLFAKLYLNRKKIQYNTSYHTKFPEFLEMMYGISQKISYSYLRWFHSKSVKILVTTPSMGKLLKLNKFENEMISWTRGVDRSLLQESYDWSHERLTRKRPLVLYVGRISVEKNLEKLLQLQDFYDIEVVGDGPQKLELEKKYPRVKFFGYKIGTELADFYSRADVFCFPSKSDTFGIVMIEAMSFGTPVAAYPVQGPLDIIEPYINGYMHNNLQKAIDQSLLCNRDKTKESSEKWTWENCWGIFKENLVERG